MTKSFMKKGVICVKLFVNKVTEANYFLLLFPKQIRFSFLLREVDPRLTRSLGQFFF